MFHSDLTYTRLRIDQERLLWTNQHLKLEACVSCIYSSGAYISHHLLM